MANQNFRVKNGLEVGTGVTISGGIVTATTFSGNATSSTYASTAGITTYSSISGISTSVIGGIGNISQLQVSGVSTFQSSVFLGDGDVLYFGDGQDLLIWHNSTDSIIRDNGTGDLNIEGGNKINLTSPTGTETYGIFNQDGAVELYYDNVKKFETTTNGITISGGQVYLNASGSNRIDFNTDGVNPPSFTTRSTGTKVVLYPTISGSSVDYSLGIAPGVLWNSVPAYDAGMYFKWFGGETEIASLSGTGNLTATSLVKSGGTSSQFLKADGSIDSSTYLTSYTETDTLNTVTNRGNSTSNGISVGIITATSLVKSGGTSSQFLKADGSVDSSTYLTSYTETDTLDSILARGNSTSRNISAGIITATSFSGTATIATYTSEWILGANGSTDYTFTGPGFTAATNDPTLYLIRGQQYKFTNTMGMHPFRIQSTPNGSIGTQYNIGITNNDVTNGTLTWNVVLNAPSVLYYQCTSHPSMGGRINILDADWSAGSGNDIYRLDGDVGIGTTNPGYKLHVVGNTNVEGNLYSTQSVIGGSSLDNTSDRLRIDASYIAGGDSKSSVFLGLAPFTSNRGGMEYVYSDPSGVERLNFFTNGNSNTRMTIDFDGNVGIGSTNPTSKLSVVGNVSVTGIISDSSGNVRAIPQNSQTSAYILAIGDVGKHISITTGGVTVNSGIFSAGDGISIYNNSVSNQTITQGGSVTMYLAGTATTGNRTLAQRGVCTILCVASNTFTIFGAGLT